MPARAATSPPSARDNSVSTSRSSRRTPTAAPVSTAVHSVKFTASESGTVGLTETKAEAVGIVRGAQIVGPDAAELVAAVTHTRDRHSVRGPRGDVPYASDVRRSGHGGHRERLGRAIHTLTRAVAVASRLEPASRDCSRDDPNGSSPEAAQNSVAKQRSSQKENSANRPAVVRTVAHLYRVRDEIRQPHASQVVLPEKRTRVESCTTRSASGLDRWFAVAIPFRYSVAPVIN